MEGKEARNMLTGLLILALLIAVSKWIVWRISFMAALLYYGEHGQEFPDPGVIQKYQTNGLKRNIKSIALWRNERKRSGVPIRCGMNKKGA